MKINGKYHRVRLGNLGRVRCEPGWHLGPGWSSGLKDYDLWFVWAGRGRMTMDAGEFELGAGSVFWMRPGRRYEVEQYPEARLGVNYVHFDLEDARGRGAADRWTPPVEAMRTRHVDFADAALRRVIALASEPDGKAVAEALLEAVLADLVHEQSSGVGAVGTFGLDKHHWEVAERVAARIRESPADTPSVAELASEAGYSADHFSRVFAKVIGEGPQEYLINAKMERSRQLLAESSMSVGMIAEALGFREVFFFSRQFRQRTGFTPTEYRKAAGRV